MGELTKSLERILNGLKKYDSYRYYQPGLSLSEIDEKVKVLPFRLPQEVYELYQWRNGFTPGKRGSMNALGGHDFHNLDFLVNHYFDFMNSSLEYALNKNSDSVPIRNPQWFSLLGHDQLDFFVIGELEQKQASPIYCFDYGDIYDFRPKLKYSSLTSMMLTIAECYETGAYYHYRVEELEQISFGMNYQLAESIRQKYNPDCEFDTPIEEKKEPI